MHKFGLVARIALAFGLIGLFSITALTIYIYRGSQKIMIERDHEQLNSSTLVSAQRLGSRVDSGRRDVLALSKAPPMLGIFRAREHGGVDPLDGSTERLWTERLATIFTGILEARPEYMQVRLVGLDGEAQEIVRVERLLDGTIIRTSAEALQHKVSRDYVTQTRLLEAGQVYVSPVNLNREHGTLETPHRPVLRVSTPIVAADGEKLAFIIINIDMAQVFDIVRNKGREGQQYYITNAQGDYLDHPNPRMTFGFELGQYHRIQDDFPAMADFLAAPTDTFAGFLNGASMRMLTVATKVRYDPDHPDNFVSVVEMLPPQELEAGLATVRNRAFLAAAVIFLLCLASIAWLIQRLSRPLLHMRNIAVSVAQGDRNVNLEQFTHRQDELGALAQSFETMVQKVDERETALQESEAQTSRVIDVMPEAILLVDRDGIIRRVNQRSEAIFGYSTEELLGSSVDSLLPERFRAQHPSHRADYRAEPTVRPMGQGRDLFALRKGGKEFPVEVALAPIGQGGDGQVVVSVSDITQRKAAADALRLSNQRLKRSNQELTQFAYVASHDLQEPLRMVDSYMGLIERRYKGKLDQDADDFIGYAVDGARRMKRLINELLAYSRVSNRALKVAQVNMRDVVSGVLAILKKPIEESRARIEVGSLPVIDADTGQMERLFQNLIGNALKFRSNDAPVITISAEKTGVEWEFQVSDNGIGIAEEFRKKVFDIFSRLHSREEYDGTGIGLAACKRIVEMHGGAIWVESKEGGGSTFHFTLPEEQEDEEA